MRKTSYFLLAWSLFVLGLSTVALAEEEKAAPAAVEKAELGDTRRVHSCGTLFLAGQPTQADIAIIKQRGVKRVISLRTDGEVDWDEQKAVEDAGLKYVELPFQELETLTDEVFDKARELLRDTKTPTLMHCGSGNRVATVWLTHRVLDQGVPLDKALEEAKMVGLRVPEFGEKARDYIRRKSDKK